ncbi:transposase [Exiguobacterium sp. SH3S2]|nr:transposase [Exiguobacterium sp. SH3S3]TCI61303.1 transposase [Exiguobacterium sp. SH3S2]
MPCSVWSTRQASMRRRAPFVGIDDFSLKKGHTYGTIICDLRTGRPIDLLPSRDTGAVLEWLDNQPRIILVSRDRFLPYAEAVRLTSHPVIDVLDRFHLVQNLWKLYETAITSILPNKIFLDEEERIDANPHQDEAERKRWDHPTWHRALEIKRARAEGESIASIARRLSISRNTVYNDINREAPIIWGKRSKSHEVQQWKGRILELEEKHLTVQQILETVRGEGYTAASRAVRLAVEAVRRDRRNISCYPEPPFIPRKRALGYLWKWHMGDAPERREVVDKLLIRFPELRPVFCFVHSFRESIRHMDGSGMLVLLTSEFERRNRFTIRFVRRLLKESAGIKNACENPESNGLVEGHVNRLKLIKRIMYGRASFRLLRIKVLYEPS